MCTSSTATPAAIDGSCPGGVLRNTSTGRSRLPPAARASFPTAATRPGWLATGRASLPPGARSLVPARRDEARRARDGAREPLLERVEIVLEPFGRADRRERLCGRAHL